MRLTQYQYSQPQDVTFSRQSKGKPVFVFEGNCLLESHFIGKKYFLPKNVLYLNLAIWNFNTQTQSKFTLPQQDLCYNWAKPLIY